MGISEYTQGVRLRARPQFPDFAAIQKGVFLVCSKGLTEHPVVDWLSPGSRRGKEASKIS